MRMTPTDRPIPGSGGRYVASLPLLQRNKPIVPPRPAPALPEAGPAAQIAPAAQPELDSGESYFAEYAAQIEPAGRLAYRGWLHVVEEFDIPPSEVSADASLLEQWIAPSMPPMEYQFALRHVSQQKRKLLRHILHRDRLPEGIDAALAREAYRAVLQNMALEVRIEGEPAPDFIPGLKPLLLQAMVQYERDRARERSRGTYFVYDLEYS